LGQGDVLFGGGGRGDSVQNEASAPSILFPAPVLWIWILRGGEWETLWLSFRFHYYESNCTEFTKI